MSRLFRNWPRLVLILLPLGILAADAAALYVEWRQPPPQKAVRLVRESKSRKENFTVQQYLYATVYYRQKKGEAITIEGWQVTPDEAAPDNQFSISFLYTDANGQHQALWEASLKEKKVTPQNREARDLSWQ
jgi:hypothetical protein